MVILFSERKSKNENEIIRYLKKYNGNYISDKTVLLNNGSFYVISSYKKINLEINKGIAVFCDDTKKFISQQLPKGIIGICDCENKNGLITLEKNNIPTITCGMSNRNTITLSSCSNDSLVITLQRSLITQENIKIEPFDFKIKINKYINPYAVMASAAVLLLKGITPKEF